MSRITSSVRPSMIGRAMAALGLLVLLAAATPARAATLVSETTWGGANSEVVGDTAVAPDGSTYLAGSPPASGRARRPSSSSSSHRTRP